MSWLRFKLRVLRRTAGFKYTGSCKKTRPSNKTLEYVKAPRTPQIQCWIGACTKSHNINVFFSQPTNTQPKPNIEFGGAGGSTTSEHKTYETVLFFARPGPPSPLKLVRQHGPQHEIKHSTSIYYVPGPGRFDPTSPSSRSLSAPWSPI